jgi:hypothetical protein
MSKEKRKNKKKEKDQRHEDRGVHEDRERLFREGILVRGSHSLLLISKGKRNIRREISEA